MLIRWQLQMWKRKFSQDWIYPVIQQLVELPLSAITWSNHFLCGFESLTSVWRPFSPLFFTALIQFIEVCRMAARQVASHLNLEHFGIQTSPWSTQWLQGAHVMWRQKQAPIITPPLSCPTVGMRCLCWYAVGIFQTWCCAAKHLHFGLISSKDIPEVLWFLIYKLIFREKNHSLASVPNKQYFFSLFLIMLSWTLTFDMLTEVSRVWDVVPFFAVPLSIVLLWVAKNTMFT